MAVCVALCVHDDSTFLSAALHILQDIPRHVFIGKLSWAGDEGEWQQVQAICEEAGATVILGTWLSEEGQRKAAYDHVRKLGFTHAIIADSDELVEPKLLDHLKRLAEGDMADRVYVEWDTYWKSPQYVIRPRERFTPCIMIKLDTAVNTHHREFENGRMLFLNESYGIIHHMSYAGSDERIWNKITSWGHKDEVVPNWWEQVWKRWDADKMLRNIHPTHPPAYGFAEHIPLQEFLAKAGIQAVEEKPPNVKLKQQPKVSVIIPALGGQEDVTRCLASLKECGELIHEIFVIDNGSSPKIKVSKGVKLVRNETNLGFGKASNQGAVMSTGDVVLFLNSDTIVPKIALERLMESLFSGDAVAAAGPYTNNSGHFQRIEPTYNSEENLDLFAQDFATRSAKDVEVDMLVGFCMALKRATLDEVGLFDERFGYGTFEDNDLSYRLRRAGYQLVISARSYIHHEGSKTMKRMATEEQEKPLDLQLLLQENHDKFASKWRNDLQSGFASGLSGLSADRIQFNGERKPEKRLERTTAMVEKADISLCMIVKNEERVIRDCLESAVPFFCEVLVLDTGSTDRTIEIARECGAVVRETKWPDSFAKARTESMKHAKGKWIMWIDADDTLPMQSAEVIVNAVASAQQDVIGFIVPVQFVEEHGQGTEVDHVKIFRNFPGIEWEGRIHEQALQSVRRQAEKAGIRDGGRLIRLEAKVMHSGYDTSEAGQEGKRIRDEKLLKLDLKDRPNHPFVLFNLGMTEHFTGTQERAVEWLEKCLKHSKKGETHIRKAYALLGAALRKLDKRDQAKARLEKGYKEIPGDPEIAFHLAQIAAEEKLYQKAADLYHEVLNADVSGVFTSLDPGIMGYKTRHNLAYVYVSLGKYEEALEQWRLALENSPRIELARNLFDTALSHKDFKTCKEAMDWVHQRNGHDEHWANMLVQLSDATGTDPAHQFDFICNAEPENSGVRKVFALHLMNTGRNQWAVDHFYYLYQRNVPEGAYFLGVMSEQDGQPEKALEWYEQAHLFNPGHLQTIEKLNELRRGGPRPE